MRLLAADTGPAAMLLERLDACRSLLDVPLELAVTVWGGVVRQLSVVPDDRPEWQEIDHVAARAEQWSDDFRRLGSVGAAVPALVARSGAGGLPDPRRRGPPLRQDVLVHTDFHYLNILARTAGQGK